MHEQLSVRASLAELCTYNYKENTYTTKKQCDKLIACHTLQDEQV